MSAMKMRIAAGIVGFAGLLSIYARAGLLDSPPPTIAGASTRVVYRLGPVYFQGGVTDTLVACTNHDIGPASVAVELFDEENRAIGMLASGVVASEATISFATSVVPNKAGIIVIRGLQPLKFGKARVSATTSRLACSAYHRVRAANGTIKEDEVALVKKVSLDVHQ
jgi:hypothetical protein